MSFIASSCPSTTLRFGAKSSWDDEDEWNRCGLYWIVANDDVVDDVGIMILVLTALAERRNHDADADPCGIDPAPDRRRRVVATLFENIIVFVIALLIIVLLMGVMICVMSSKTMCPGSRCTRRGGTVRPMLLLEVQFDAAFDCCCDIFDDCPRMLMIPKQREKQVKKKLEAEWREKTDGEKFGERTRKWQLTNYPWLDQC
jgi:hypothetical protein